MDFKQLTTFMTVSRLLNFTKAAEQLGYAQSSITAQIQQLELELGTVLFERIGRKVILTDAGERLIPFAAEILHLSDHMKNNVSNPSEPIGKLTIGTAESLSIYRLPPILSEYRKRYPAVELQLKLLSCTDFIPGLSNGQIDVAFTIGEKMEGKLIQEAAVLSEKIMILAPSGHPLTLKKTVGIKDLETESLLLTGRDCSYRGAFLKQLTEHNVIPRIALETDSIQVIKQASMSGLGICVLPEVSVMEEVALNRLVPLPISTEHFQIVSQMLYHRDKYLTPALKEFLRISEQILDNKRCDRQNDPANKTQENRFSSILY